MPFWIIGLLAFLAGVALMEITILIGIMIMIAGVAIMFIYLTMRPKFPVKALIFQKRHGNVRMVWDMATRIKIDPKEDTYKYVFKKLKDETKAARYENLYPSGRGEIAMFFSPAPGEYYQATFRENIITRQKELVFEDPNDPNKVITKTVKFQEAEIQPIPDDLLEWGILKAQRAKQRYDKASAWDKYYPFVVAAVMMMLLGVVIAMLFNSMGPVADSWEKASGNFKDAADKMAAAAERLADKEQGVQQPNMVIQGSQTPPPPDVG